MTIATCAQGGFTPAALGLAAFFTVACGAAHGQTTQTCFYEHYDYQGASYCTTALQGDTTAPVVDKVSSVKVQAGKKTLLYEHTGFGGRALTLQADTPNLNNLGFNNLTSSFRVEAPPPPPPPPPPVGQACFYEHYDYQGASYCTTSAQGDIVVPVIDKVSSVKLSAGNSAVLYENPAFGGRTLSLGGSTANLNSLGFNNLTSSYKVSAAPSGDKQILFIGNSFTHGHADPVYHYNAAGITDLNGSGMGGVPGIFKQLTVEAGLKYAVHIEAVSSQTLQYHYTYKQPAIGSKPWDVVVMHDHSLMDPKAPGNPASLIQYSRLLEQLVHGAGNANGNPNAQVFLLETWARADQVYLSSGLWYGQTVEQMGADLHNGYHQAAVQDPAITGVLPVGDAFLLAISTGNADRNPYDGIDPGKEKPWFEDNYHASVWASYLEALVAFGRITGVDPRTLGANSAAARGLGLSTTQATRAQDVAYRQVWEGTPH